MDTQTPIAGTHCIFEYLYRDGGNWKTHGSVLLSGEAVDDASELIQRCCESGGLFVAEQVGVPSLCFEHFESCGEGPSDLDHAYHEFVGLRAATDEEATTMLLAGALGDLIQQMRAAAGHWDVTLSPNCYL